MSSVNPNNIDGTYPIAGQDNDSQGFRDNFTNIKNNFTFAASELSDLQNNAILKSALSGTTLNNNLNNAQLIGAQISKFTETRNDLGTISSGNITVNWSDAHFQTVALTSNTILTLANWPTSGFWTKLVLDVYPTVSNLALTLPTSVSSVSKNTIQGFSGNAVILPTANVAYRFEFSTYDGGTTVTMRDLFRNSTGDTVVSGSLTTQGAIIQTGIQQYSPTANIAITANVGISRVLITPTPSGGITSFFADVTLPNTTVNGTVVSISSNVAVNQLRALGPWLSTVSPSANVTLTAGSQVQYQYISADGKWYKIA